MHISCIIMHILNFLEFFLCFLDLYLPPPKRIRILSALVFGPGSDFTPDTRHYTNRHTLKNIGRNTSYASMGNKLQFTTRHVLHAINSIDSHVLGLAYNADVGNVQFNFVQTAHHTAKSVAPSTLQTDGAAQASLPASSPTAAPAPGTPFIGYPGQGGIMSTCGMCPV